MAGVLFTEGEAGRIEDAARWVEAHLGSRGHDAAPPPVADLLFVRGTSATEDADGNYPGVITARNGTAGTWTDYGAVKVKPVYGPSANGVIMACRPAGRAPGGDEVYVAAQAGVYVVLASGDYNPATTLTAACTVRLEISDRDCEWSPSVASSPDTGLRAYVNPGSTNFTALYMRLAAYGVPGTVSTTTQTFSGSKTFHDVAGFTAGLSAPGFIGPNNPGVDGDPGASSGDALIVTAPSWYSGGYQNRATIGFYRGALYLYSNKHNTSDATPRGLTGLYVSDGASWQTGYTGSVTYGTGGLTFLNGICTNAASGGGIDGTFP